MDVEGTSKPRGYREYHRLLEAGHLRQLAHRALSLHEVCNKAQNEKVARASPRATCANVERRTGLEPATISLEG